MRSHSLAAFMGLLLSSSALSLSAQAASLEGAAQKLGVATTFSVEFSGSGQWFQFGQAPVPGGPWPQFDVSSYKAAFNLDGGASHVTLTRIQSVSPDRLRPAPVEQKVDAWLNDDKAWTLVPARGAGADAAPLAVAAPETVEERQVEILSTPQGFLKAALAHEAASEPLGSGVAITFNTGLRQFEGFIDSEDRLAAIRTWIDTPVLGDTVFETRFADYKDFGGVLFPADITRSEGGFPILHLTVASVKLNSDLKYTIPENVAKALPAPVTVKCDKIADNVLYLTGGTHHSVAVIEKDHIVLIEAPLNEARSLALIQKLHEVVSSKQITKVINSHAHFDHAGGLRTFVDLNATIVTQEADRDYYFKAWASPHTLNPDRLEISIKPAKFETYKDEYSLEDGDVQIRIYRLKGSGHSDDLALIYLPQAKIAIEADAYSPLPADAPVPKTVNPFAVNLLENIEQNKLDVEKIVGLHGARVASLDDLKAFVGQIQAAK